MGDVYSILTNVLAIYCLLITIVGTIGNIMTFFTCTRKRLRVITTFVFLSFMSLNDMFCLYIWNLSHFILTFYGYYQQNTNLPWCRISSLIQNVSLQWSAWLLVAISTERYFSVRIKTWRISYFNAKKAFITSAVIGSLIITLNFHMLFTNGYIGEVNGTTIIYCYSSLGNSAFPAWLMVHGYIYSFVPFALLLVMNSLLVYQTLSKKATATVSDASVTKRKHMSMTIMLMTAAFIIMTLPTALAGGYFFGDLIGTVPGRLVLFFCDCLSFSYHSLNFVVFLIFNKQFRLEWKNILSAYQTNNKNQVGVTTTATANY